MEIPEVPLPLVVPLSCDTFFFSQSNLCLNCQFHLHPFDPLFIPIATVTTCFSENICPVRVTSLETNSAIIFQKVSLREVTRLRQNEIPKALVLDKTVFDHLQYSGPAVHLPVRGLPAGGEEVRQNSECLT